MHHVGRCAARSSEVGSRGRQFPLFDRIVIVMTAIILLIIMITMIPMIVLMLICVWLRSPRVGSRGRQFPLLQTLP